MERKEAIALGLKLYNTGRVCSKGHFSPRYTNTGACRDCIKGYANTTRAKLNNQIATQRVTRTYSVHVEDADALDAMFDMLNGARLAQMQASEAERARQLDEDIRRLHSNMGGGLFPGVTPVIIGGE